MILGIAKRSIRMRHRWPRSARTVLMWPLNVRLTFQLLRVVAQMVRHEGLHEVVAVIVARLHAQAERLTRLCGGRGEYFRHQLLGQKLIPGALIDEDRSRKRPARDQLAGVVLAPTLGIRPEIIGERLLSP